jgi:stringent starvation protein B
VPGKTNGATVSEVSHLPDDGNEPPKKGGRPTLTRIK